MLRRRAAFFFLMLSLAVMVHVCLLYPLLKVAARDAWIATIFTLPTGFFVAYLTWKLMNINPEATLVETTNHLFGPFWAFFFHSIWLLYFFSIAALSIANLMSLLVGGFFEETPMWALGLAIIPLVIYGLSKGIKTIAWVAGVLTLTTLVTGHTITLGLTPERNFRNLLPIFEYGYTPTLIGAIFMSAAWTEICVLASLRFHRVETKGMLHILWFGVLANVIMMFSVTTGTISIFGFEAANDMSYPALYSVRMVSLGFIDRMDVYAVLSMTFGVFIRASLFLYAALQIIPKKITKKYNNLSIIIGGIAVYLTSLFIYKDFLQFTQLMRYYFFTIFLWIIPIIYLIRNWMLKRKNA